MSNWIIEKLNKSHRRDGFSCGNLQLDNFLKKLASQYEKKSMGLTYVAVLPDDLNVKGYYTLAAGSVASASLPNSVSKKLPNHPAPVVHLGRLAIDQTIQKQGLGKILLMDALKRSWEISKQMGIFAIEVYAIDDSAKNYYLKYGFEPLKDEERHLYLSMKVVEKLFTS